MEKGFNGLACRTDAEMGAVAGTQDVIGFSFSWRNDLNFPAFLQRICPISITISPVSEQVAKRNRSAVSVDLFCSQQIGAGRRRNLCGPEKREPAGSEHNKDMELHAIIPLLPCGIAAFVTEPGSDSCACAVRVCLKFFDKREGKADNKGKQAGDEGECDNIQAISAGKSMRRYERI